MIMKRLFITVHDASPYFQKELEIIFNSLTKLKVKKFNILVVPNWHDRFNISENEKFITLIKNNLDRGIIVLHGFNHKSHNKTLTFLDFFSGFSAVHEFRLLTEKQIENKLMKGLKIIKSAFNVKPEGFVPPGWVFPVKRKQVLKKHFKCYTSLNSIDYFDFIIKSVPIGYTAGRYNILSKAITVISGFRIKMLKKGTIRFAIHCDELKQGNFVHLIKDLEYLLKNNWQPYVYEDFI